MAFQIHDDPGEACPGVVAISAVVGVAAAAAAGCREVGVVGAEVRKVRLPISKTLLVFRQVIAQSGADRETPLLVVELARGNDLREVGCEENAIGVPIDHRIDGAADWLESRAMVDFAADAGNITVKV